MLTKLKLICIALGIGQKELAKRTNLSQSYISLLHKGRRKASPDAKKKIAKALRMRPKDVFD